MFDVGVKVGEILGGLEVDFAVVGVCGGVHFEGEGERRRRQRC